MSESQPFKGLRVVEIGQFIAAPYCAQLLAQGGAFVTKVEPLEGDAVRHLNPIDGIESRNFLTRARGKQSLPLNIRHPKAASILDALLRNADVVLMNFRPGLAQELGLDTSTLRSIYPRLIIAVVTAFGRYGPDGHRAGMDIVVQARSGLMVANGRQKEGCPVAGDPASADYMCASLLAFGIASALFRRERTGEGGELHASLFQAALALQNTDMVRVDAIDGQNHKAYQNTLMDQRMTWVGYEEIRSDVPTQRTIALRKVYLRSYHTSDGWLVVSCGSLRLRHLFIEVLGLNDSSLDDGSVSDDEEHYEALRLKTERIMASDSTENWQNRFNSIGIPVSDVRFPIEVLDDPQAAENKMFEDVVHPDFGTIRLLAAPLALDGDGFRALPIPGPFASETREILDRLGFTSDEIDAFLSSGVTRDA